MAFDKTNAVESIDTWRRQARVFFKRLGRKIDHEAVVEHAREEGQTSGRYVFMAVMSCAIATLGLLLSSPAVIIGAMLISPLMGPIMLMGFSLSILDLAALRRAILTMALGVLAAVTISFLIVRLSPLTEITPEIIARTRPNFFDLLVAIFSGLAGGYAVIQRKGETIVGVAIATALMPPLAVTGYGLAVGSMAVAGGSFFLFMTNLLAIALSVTVLSRLYGFGANHGSRSTMWQSAMVLAVFAALSLPLGIALRDIAYEATAINTVKDALLDPFDDNESRISDVSVQFPKREAIRVDATILTRTRVPEAESQLTAELTSRLGRPVDINLGQVLINEDKTLEAEAFLRMADTSIAAPLRAEISRLQTFGELRQTETELRAAIPFELSAADINADAKTATLVAAPHDGLSISAYRTMETGLQTNFPEWKIRLVPPVSELPLINFANGEAVLSPAGESVLGDSIWALQHWSVSTVETVGYASTAGELRRFDNETLAYRRAAAVANRLTQAGIIATPIGEYRAYRQAADEKQLGYQRFQTVLIRPGS
ncbi:MAG: DUF389 domain-containing protein [Alphaproteobacteria bacterium]|nr:DUF389 domain-containing protein [Alphaproteobacteria bacterium]MBU2083976.1 DUF389 domain-containing protein [Alphaproteobacteria bacterium]MBU2142640.1 DUF389 domain-containing protein [Alphaproteobacteria bacterium]MBU2196253.1 DUF389 domain-containing protein [Alphaproteobacteria bacterium]